MHKKKVFSIFVIFYNTDKYNKFSSENRIIRHREAAQTLQSVQYSTDSTYSTIRTLQYNSIQSRQNAYRTGDSTYSSSSIYRYTVHTAQTAQSVLQVQYKYKINIR